MAMERFELRIEEEQLNRVDDWAAAQADRPARAEAVRRLMDQGIAASSSRTVNFSDGEKALMLMMKDIYKHLQVEGEMDPNFFAKVIYGGHYWAPKWELTGLFHDHVDDPRELTHVVNILDTWTFIEEAYEKLSTSEKKQIADAVPHNNVTFTGFDGNNESGQLNIAQFLIVEMNRFSRFQGRDLNSHYPAYAGYCRMANLFKTIRPTLIGHGLNVSQLIAIFKAKQYTESL